MSSIKGRDSLVEMDLAKSLWRKGYRYRKNDKKVYGKPDLTFKRLKVAIFVDGDFWHGKDWDEKKFQIKSRREFWWPKIERNIQRDKEVNRELINSGWLVLRFWESDIKKDINSCLKLIESKISERKQ